MPESSAPELLYNGWGGARVVNSVVSVICKYLLV